MVGQKNTKPKAEDVIPELLNGETEKAALSFTEFMRENKMPLKWASNNAWKASYKGKSVCYMIVNANGDWVIRFSQLTRDKWFVDYDDYITGAGLKEFVINNINRRLCPGRECGASKNKTILGKTFDEVCKCWPLYMRNFDGVDLENAKQLVLLIKKYITDLAGK